jgi:hypothetical protein
MLAFILGLTVAWILNDVFNDDFGCDPDRDDHNTTHYWV